MSLLNHLPYDSGKPPTSPEIERRSANYHPSIWEDFLGKLSSQCKDSTNSSSLPMIDELKIEVQKMLASAIEPRQEIYLIDIIQRAGIAYHFEDEIGQALDRIYASPTGSFDDSDVHMVALHFRLLREKGYHVSSDVFQKLKDEKGNFKKDIVNDINGMLSLYEAAHLGTEGEVILDEALQFTKGCLKEVMPSLKGPLAEQVKHALELPLRWGTERLKSRQFISCYEHDESRNEAILELAKLDFNYLQALHQSELVDLHRWWKDTNVVAKLPFIRDRLVECYFWIIEVYYEPQYSIARNITTKIICLASMLDDIYDIYGTYEELELFSNALERWERKAMEQLPDYMKVAYTAILDTVDSIEELFKPDEKPYRKHYLKEAVNYLARAYFTEAKWFYSKYVPTFEEYMMNALMSSGYPMLSVIAFVGIDSNMVTEEFLEWAINCPKIVEASALIARLQDDITTHKNEQERGDAASAIECYMQEYSSSEQEASKALRLMVEKGWKVLNKECMKPTPVPHPLLKPILNLTRVIHVLYQYGDGYSDSKNVTKARLTSVLVDPIPI